MKRNKKGIFKRIVSLVAALSLLLGVLAPLCVSAAGSDGGSSLDRDGNGSIKYLAIGSSDALGSYPQAVASGLEASSKKQVESEIFAFDGMRIEELLYLLDESFEADGYTAEEFLAAGGAFSADVENLRAELKASIAGAEIISLDTSFDSFATYALSYIFDSKYGADFTRFDEGMQDSIQEIKGRFDDVVVGYFSDPTNPNSAEVADFIQRAIDAFAYALVSYCYSFDRVLSEIYTINPNAQIVAVGARNPMTDLSAKMEGLGIEIPLDLIYGIVVDITNVYMASLSEFADAFYFAYYDGTKSERGVYSEIKSYNGNPASLSEDAKQRLLSASGLDLSSATDAEKLSVINAMAYLAKLGTKETVIDFSFAAFAEGTNEKIDEILKKALANPEFNPLTSAEYKAIEADKTSRIHLAAIARYRLGAFATLLDENDGKILGAKIVSAINNETLGSDVVRNEMNGIYSLLSDFFGRETLLDLEYAFNPYYTCDENSYYLALGDDSAYDEYDALGRLKRASYASKLADKLVSEYGFDKKNSYKNLASKTETPEKLLDLILNGASSTDKKEREKAEELLNSLKKADLITISYTNLETTKFMFGKAKVDWEGLLGKEIADQVESFKAMLKTEMGAAGIDKSVLDIIIPFMERYAYAYASRIVSYVKLLEEIHEIAPDALVVIVGTYNDMEDFTLSLGDRSLPVGNYVQYLIDAANLETLGYSILKEKTAYIAAPDVETIHEKNGGTKDFDVFRLLLTMGTIVNGGDLLPSDRGHAYITDMVVKTVNLVGAHECVYDNACDNRCDICKTKREIGDHKYGALCDTDCDECGARRVAAHHAYDADCDNTCNTCGEVREAREHLYVSECDEYCDLCSLKRETSADHSFGDWEKKGSERVRECVGCGETETERAGLGAGAVVAIVLGAVVVLGGCGFVAYLYGFKKKGLPTARGNRENK